MTKTHGPKQITDTLNQMATAIAAGKTVEEASRDCDVAPATYYQWRRKYGGMKFSQVKACLEKAEAVKCLKKRIVDLSTDNAILRDVLKKLLVSSDQKRWAIRYVQESRGISERRACAALSLPRSSHRYRRSQGKERAPLVAALRAARQENPQLGYRRLAALLRAEGWRVSDIQIYRLMRRPEFSSGE